MAGFEWISFTTDYGLSDGFVAACRGRIASIAPQARVIDVTHLIPPQNLRQGASVLAQTIAFLPRAVHLVVIDPGVGTQRRGVVVTTPGGVFVGPDNGVLSDAAAVLGGIERVVELTNSDYWMPQVSATFHGRDVFAPVAAHLACGVPAERMGVEIDPAALVRLPDPTVRSAPKYLEAEVISVDHFGTVQLAATTTELVDCHLPLGTAVTVRACDVAMTATMARTFADVDVGALVVLSDSADHVAVARNGGSAADLLGCGVGATITVTVR